MCFQICTNTNIYYAFNKWYDTNTTIKNNLFIFYIKLETKIDKPLIYKGLSTLFKAISAILLLIYYV